jgi:ribulose-phosphate 3-epimerase
MPDSIRIIPAVLTDDAETLRKLLRQAEEYTDYVQIDIMDGKFVPSHSITWQQIAEVRTNLRWEAHLMVEQPEHQFKDYQKAGARKVIFHYEAAPAPEKAITAARKLNLEVGLAINPETDISTILSLTDKVDSVLFLSVHPGFYGAKFLPEVLDKVVELRRLRPGLKIGIDGGIKENNIVQVARIGVNEICVGSAILMQPDPGQAYRKLRSMVA